MGGDVMFETVFALDPMIEEVYKFFKGVHAKEVKPVTACGPELGQLRLDLNLFVISLLTGGAAAEKAA